MTKLKILLVDDEPDFLDVMRKRLETWGYEMITAGGGEEAIARLESKPDIVILDYKMPRMDGLATLKKIRKSHKNLPVVMLTAYPAPKLMDRTGKLGVCAFIPKYSEYTDIQTALKTSLDLLKKRDGK